MSKDLFVPGVPVAKARPRMTRKGHTYTPKKTEDAERMIRNAWVESNGENPVSYPLKVEIKFVYEIPKSWPKWKRAQVGSGLPKVSRPDTDNLVKTVLDALNSVAYEDDSFIYNMTATKIYSDTEEAGTYVRMYPWDGEKKDEHAWYWE